MVVFQLGCIGHNRKAALDISEYLSVVDGTTVVFLTLWAGGGCDELED